MESELLEGIHKRFVRSFLDYVILLGLRNGPLSGPDIIKFIHERHYMLLSASTVYTCLYTLESDGLVEIEKNSGKRIFSLTGQGEEVTREILDAKTKILGLFLDAFVSK